MSRLLLFGTPEFSVPAFEALIEDPQFEIAGVLTQPDKAVGRGMQLKPTPVKRLAERFSIPVLQPTTLRGLELHQGKLSGVNEDTARTANELNALGSIDLSVVIAYGKILPLSILNLGRVGALNVHASILPRWRGAAPIQRALFAGDRTTGICLMKMEEGLDTGPVYSMKEVEIEEDDNFQTLHDKLAAVGRDLLRANLQPILNGSLQPKPQPEAGITYASKWEKADSRINWGEPAETSINRIRASTPPGAWCNYKGETLKIFSASLEAGVDARTEPGSIVHCSDGKLIVATASSQYIAIHEVQLPGRNRLKVAEVLKGRAFSLGEKFE